MNPEVLKEFLNEHVIPLKTKFDDYLPVVLGIRRATQIVVPAELPDAAILGATIDDRFRQKMQGRRLPGESLGQFFKDKAGKFWRRNQMQEIRYRTGVLRDLYADVVEGSHSYQVYMKWVDKLGLQRKELESRPTIREIYLFTDPQVAIELEELQDLRKDIRYEAMKSPDPSTPPYAKAFPEEKNAGYLKKLGSILGFPVCCIDRYIFDRDSGVLTPEARASSQLTGVESPDEIDPFAFFTKDFFPCQPDCPEAAKIGKAIYEKLSQIDRGLAEEYKKHLMDNVSLVRNYPEIIQKKIEALEKSLGRTGEGDRLEE
ncbi:MAG TPA: hypothetical protein GXX30_07810 [Firmicutes bacterium]|nr:hypothetical protein [Candidatus Fermentithermobacillaceae bacterium]